jgi:GntR family transcriptional regulator, rspAB operon transcriptional repressor
MIKISDFQPLKYRVYEEIKKSIIDLSLLPNEQLIEQNLAGRLSVSKSPIREALQRLEREGLVYTLPFKGCFVTEITETDIREIYHLREALETFCAKQICARNSAEEILEFRAILVEADAALSQDNLKGAYSIDIKMHDLLISNSKNKKIIQTYSTLRDHVDRYSNIMGLISGRVTKSHQEHGQIINALAQGDEIQVEKSISAHLRGVLDEFIESKEFKSFCKGTVKKFI